MHNENELSINMDKIKDLVLLNWANYTMNLINDVSYNSTMNGILELRDKLYTNFYIPIKMDEFTYSDAVNDNPNGSKDNLISAYHTNIRDDVKAFNDELNDVFEFENSPYAKAIVVLDGKVVEDDDVVVRKDNKVITYVSKDYKIYLPLELIEGMKESDVTDTIKYRNKIYVNSSYVNIYE